MLFQTIFGLFSPGNQIKQTENVSSFWWRSRMALMFEARFLPLLHLCEVCDNCSIRLGHDWNNFYEKTDHFQHLRADKLSAFFKSEAFTFPSAGFVEFINSDQKHCKILKDFRSLFAYCISLTNVFFFVFSIAAFLSFTFCRSDSQLFVVWSSIRQLL